MTTPAQAAALIADFGQLVGLEDLSLDDAGVGDFDVADGGAGLRIRYDDSRQCLALEGRLRFDDAPPTGTMTAMLVHNASVVGRRGDVLALEAEPTSLLLVRWLGDVPDAQTLAREVERAIADTLEWRDPAALDAATESSLPEPDPRMRV